MRLTFLGTGTSFGVPQIGCSCAVCRSTDPRDKRSRSAALIQAGGSSILIDTPPEPLDRLRRSFSYIFDDQRAYEGTLKPSLDLKALEPGRATEVAGVEFLPLAFRHGHLRVYGYRVGALAYITDVKAVDEAERARLRGLDTLVLNALWWRSHPTHLSIAEAIETSQSLGARRTYLTHLTHETGHAELAGQLPAGIVPAYDGLTVEVP